MPFWNNMLHKSNKINKSVERVTLLDIPEEIVRYIARYLMIEDVLHLSMTCKILNHMLPKYSFEYKQLDLTSIDLSFDSPPLTSHLFMATMSVKLWKHYIPGQRITNISIQLIRPQCVSKESVVTVIHHGQLNALSCRKAMVGFLTIEDPIINMVQAGDYFRFIKDMPAKEFRIHTRGLCIRQKTTTQNGDSNALMRDSSVMLHSKKESFSNVISMFKKQDEKTIIKKKKNSRTVMIPFTHYKYDYQFMPVL